MNNKTKGKILETIVMMIEKSLSDTSNMKLIPNYKEKDKDGIVREIDVYIETKQRGRIIKFGIECKNYNYKYPISLEKIDAFLYKCGKLNIDHPIFVTTSKFQSGAIQRAKVNNIDLIEISSKNQTEDEIGEQFNIKESYLIKRDFQIKKLEFKSDKFQELFNKPKFKLQGKLYNKRHEKINLKSLKRELVETNLPMLYKYLITNTGLLINSKKTIFPSFNVTGLYIKENQQYYPIESIRAVIEIWFEYKKNVFNEVQEYRDITTQKILASFISNEFTINEEPLVFNIVKNFKEKTEFFVRSLNDKEAVTQLQDLTDTSDFWKNAQFRQREVKELSVKKKFLEYKLSNNATKNVEANSKVPEPSEKFFDKKKKAKSFVCVIPEQQKLFFLLLVENDNIMYTSTFPDPINLLFTHSVNQFSEAESLKKKFPISTNGEIGENDVNILLDDTYYKYFQAKISSITFLRMALEGFINKELPSTLNKEWNNKILNKEQVEKKLSLIDKLTILHSFKENLSKQIRKEQLDLVREVSALSENFMNLTGTNEKNNLPKYLSIFESLEDFDILGSIKKSEKFMNVFKSDYIEIIE